MNPTTIRDLKPFYTLFVEALTLVKKNIHSLALISIIPLVFVGASQAALTAFAPGSGWGLIIPYSILGIAFMIVAFFFRIIYPLTVVRSIDTLNTTGLEGVVQAIDPISQYKKSFSDFWSYLFIVVIFWLAIVASSLFLIVPGIIAFMYFCLYSFVYVFEGKRGTQALVGSAWLVRGRLYEVFQRIFPAVLIMILAALIISLVVGMLLGVAGFDQSVSEFVTSIFVVMFVMPFLYSFGYFLYRDLALGTGSEVDPHFAKTAKVWVTVLSILGILFIVFVPVVLVLLVMFGKLIVT
jgi:hypothetical protein